MKRPFGRRELISISVYAFALSFLWNSWNIAVVPRQVALLVPEAQKNTFLGLAQFVGLFLALVVQPWAGAMSDRYRSRWGRRRAFIVVGTLGDMLAFIIFGLAGNFALLLIAVSLLQITSNVAHGPYQGLIPDLVPQNRQGSASAMKSIFEILAAIVTSLVMGQLLDAGQLWLAIGIFAAVMLGAALLTVVLVHEEPSAVALETDAPSLRQMVGALTRSTDFAWYVASRLFLLLGLAGVRNFAFNFITDVLQSSEPAKMTLYLQVVLAGCVLLTSIPVGYLSDRMGRKRLNYVSGAIGAVGALLITQVTTFEQFLLFGTLIGISLGIFFTANWALAMDLIPPAEAALFLGLTNIATAGSGALAGIFGPFVDTMKVMFPGHGYTLLFLAAAICYVVGTLMLVPVHERRRVESASPVG